MSLTFIRSLVLAGALISIALNPFLFAALSHFAAGCLNVLTWPVALNSEKTPTPSCQ